MLCQCLIFYRYNKKNIVSLKLKRLSSMTFSYILTINSSEPDIEKKKLKIPESKQLLLITHKERCYRITRWINCRVNFRNHTKTNIRIIV